MNINKINFTGWNRNTLFPKFNENIDYSINRLGEIKDIELSYTKEGLLKASKNGEDIFVRQTTPDSFEKDLILMHKTLLPQVRTLDEIIDAMSMEG